MKKTVGKETPSKASAVKEPVTKEKPKTKTAPAPAAAAPVRAAAVAHDPAPRSSSSDFQSAYVETRFENL